MHKDIKVQVSDTTMLMKEQMMMNHDVWERSQMMKTHPFGKKFLVYSVSGPLLIKDCQNYDPTFDERLAIVLMC